MPEKKPITVRVTEKTYDWIQQQKENEGESDSAATRKILNRSRKNESRQQQLQSRIKSLQSELEAKENRIEELQNELMQTNKRIDANTEIVEFAEKQKQIQDKETMRRRMKENAPIWKRTKWKLFGVPLDLEDGEIEEM